ncbi:AAA family ATPase [Bradyrhizobium sp. 174]|uniref:ATP-binding protein n=1 Tax=Bradyrhizobium sp. 174 TaxID=2782645 RepID=UPI001FFBB3BD|nr:AAA family ATPase [Bradyrhizobium sp. 174]MCK1570789.1 AAA family ATPase [Bradyrhizobium sp. 174]
MNKKDQHDEFEELRKRAQEQTRTHEQEDIAERLKKVRFYWHGEPTGRGLERWLVKNLIQETGTGLASGSWGSGKTFGVLDLAGSVITGLPFAGYPISRTGGVLFIAAEGGAAIEKRLRGLVEHKLKNEADVARMTGADPVKADLDHLPFAWIDSSPHLKSAPSFKFLSAIVKQAADQCREKFGVNLALIVIDTLSKAADFDDANSTSENQRVFNGLTDVSTESGAFVLTVDHFGKNLEAGTRGPVAKEDTCELVLAFLCNRSLAGVVSNTRMAVRKAKDSEEQGKTIPFNLAQVKIADPISAVEVTTCIIEWQTTNAARERAAPNRVGKPVRIFVDALQSVLRKQGKKIHPDGADEVVAAAEPDLRAEFMAIYPGSAETKRKAYQRALGEARLELIGSRQIGGVDLIWLAVDQEAEDVEF